VTGSRRVGRTPPVAPVRWLGVARLAYGAVLLVAPGWLLRRAGSTAVGGQRSRTVVRALGFRHLGQSILELVDCPPGEGTSSRTENGSFRRGRSESQADRSDR
jgi:hypothetical protein